MMSTLLTTIEAGQRLGVTRWQILALIKAGRLPATKAGRDWLIAEDDLRQAEHERRPRGRPRKDQR